MLNSTNLFAPGARRWLIIIVATVALASLIVVNAWGQDASGPGKSADLTKQARDLVETGEFEQALEIAEKLARKYSTRYSAGRLLIWIRDKQGQADLAQADLKRWQRAYPNDSGIDVLLAWYYRKSDQPTKARNLLIEALQKNRGLLVAYRYLASIEAEEGRRVKAVRWLVKMVQARKSAIDDAQWRVIDIAGSKTEALELLKELRLENGLDRDFSLAWALAAVAQTAQMTDEAVVYYRKAIKLQPRLGQLYVYLIKLQLRQGRADQALATISQADKAEALGVSSFYQLEGLAHLLKDDMKSAIVSLEAAVGLEPSDAGAREVLASALLTVGRPDEAAKHLRRLVGKDSSRQSVYRQLMEAYLADGYAQRAVELATKVVAKPRLKPMTSLTAAQVFLDAKRYEQAVKILDNLSVQPQQRGLWQVLWIKALLGEKKRRQVRKEMAAWLGEINTLDKRAEFAAHMAMVLARNDEKTMSVKLASRELKSNPNHHLLRETLIQVLLEKKDYKRVKKFMADWSTEQNQSHMKRLRTMVLLEEKNYPKAQYELQSLIRENPDDVTSLHLLGAIYESTGKTEQANEQYETILKINPNDVWANNNLGYALAQANERLADAQEMIFLALRGGPSEATIADSMGWVLYKQGRFAKATGYLARAVRLTDEPRGEVLEHLGDAFYRLKENSRAVEAWKAGLHAEQSNEHGDARMLKRLQKKLKMVESKQRPPVAWSVVDQIG